MSSSSSNIPSCVIPVQQGGLAYAGDILPSEAYKLLTEQGGVLIDVRTLEEWAEGVADVTATQGKMLNISWKTAPNYALNPNFVEQVAAAVNDEDKETPLYFLCRSGGRSLDAAVAMTAAGYKNSYNVAGGFLGASSPQPAGWVNAQLPWKKG